jgi:isocitrate dehydrogenase (NAD+)
VPYDHVDLVVVRENTEGLYSGQEHFVVPGVVESLRIITRGACERIVRYAFELARQGGRRRVTFCHKAEVMPLSDGLFLDTARAVADDYPFLEFEEIPVDKLCMQLALDPTRYDVLVMENLFGDVLSDLCAGLVGGLGLVPGANIGARYAVFEAVHGSAPDIAGKGLANPIALIRSAAMMLEHIGQREVARRVEASVRRTLESGLGRTRDLGGEGNTATLTERLIANLASD